MAGWVAARPTPRAAVPLKSVRTAAATGGPHFSATAKPLAVGASVMLAASPALEPRIVVDAAVGRQPPRHRRRGFGATATPITCRGG